MERDDISNPVDERPRRTGPARKTCATTSLVPNKAQVKQAMSQTRSPVGAASTRSSN